MPDLDELERKSRLLTAILDSVGDGLIVVAPDGTIPLMNRGAATLFPSGADAVTAAAWLERCPLFRDDGQTEYAPADRPLNRALRGEAVREVAMIPARGQTPARWVEVTAQPVRSPSGELEAVVRIDRDVTEERRRLQEIQDLEARHRVISDLTSDYACGLRLEPDGRVVMEWATDGFERVTGYTVETLAAAGGVDAFTLPGDEATMRANQEAVGRGDPGTVQARIRTRAGAIRWIRYRFDVVPAPAGQPVRRIGAVQDVTAEVTAQLKLLEAQATLQSLVDALPQQLARLDAGEVGSEVPALGQQFHAARTLLDALLEHVPLSVFAKSADGRFRVVNRRWEQMVGFTREQVLGLRSVEFLPPEIALEFELSDQPALRDGVTSVREHSLGAGADVQHLRTVKFPLRDRAGAVIGVGGVSEDITERKRADESRRATLEEMQALSRRLQDVREEERTRIAREVHDELGQGLTSVKLDLSWLRKAFAASPPAPDEVQASLSTMIAQVDAVILSVRRIATELRPAILDDFGLRSALEWLVGDFKSHARLNCTLTAEGREQPPRPGLDTALFRIAQEALTNVARHAGATCARITLSDGDDACTLAIEDDGVGIDRSALAGTRSLGLLGMRERAAGIGGAVHISRLPAGGTRVEAVVPLRGDPSPIQERA